MEKGGCVDGIDGGKRYRYSAKNRLKEHVLFAAKIWEHAKDWKPREMT
jgi:uncharacterized membrane protein